jgi:hypothetical protein
VEYLSAVLVLCCYVTHVVHKVNTYLSNAVFPATKLSFRWYSVIQHAYCKIFGYSHTMNQLTIGHVSIIAFSHKMVQITTPWSLALFMRNTLYRRNGQTKPKLAALFYKHTHTSSVDTKTWPVALNFIYRCIYVFIPHGTVFLATTCRAVRNTENGFEMLESWISTSASV